MESASPTFSGYRRQRKTRLSVRIGEIGSRFFITLGGIGTIVAIVLVCVFLVWVTLPLFKMPSTQEQGQVSTNWPADPLMFGVEGDQILGWAVLKDGMLIGFRLDNGEVVSRQKLIEGVQITAVSPPSRHEQVLFGLADGTLRLGKIAATSHVLDEEKVPENLKTLPQKSAVKYQDGIAYRHETGKLNWYQVKATLEPAISLAPGTAIISVDVTTRAEGPILTALTADGMLHVSELQSTKNLITGQVKRTVIDGVYQVKHASEKRLPGYVLIDGVGNNVFLIWKEGLLQRIYCKEIKTPEKVEEVSLTVPGVEVSAVQFMIGKTTLLVGDSSGRVRAWFCTKPVGYESGGGAKLEPAHELPAGAAAVTSLAASPRSRVMAAGYADGSVRLANLTNELELSHLQMQEKVAINRLLLAPKENGLYACSKAGVAAWHLELGHPEISMASLLRPVWYEGFTGPTYTWQSSSGDDAFEPKFSLIPLIFGTLKATFYSLLIGVPLALCAAVYSREFLHQRIRAVVKPTIEVMASLPSVVLGFLGALVVAPFVESALTPILFGFIIVPLGFVVAGFLWHALPTKWIRQLSDKRFLFIMVLLPCLILLARAVSPSIERLLFDGDLKRWLRQTGVRSSSGWFLLMLPLAGLLMLFFMANVVNPRLRVISQQISASREAFVNLCKCGIGIVLTVLIAWIIAWGMEGMGLDPRKSIFGVYDQRNALVVGFMMGFAIIPIIYTLAEDALTSVPDHLRSASLGCGATTWQTAARIVLPTAMSGIFSAVMVGLGRAVGETMIVLMAAGNMPVLEMNIFNGFRTLSANIAVELPEAVQGSSHYRTLFLAALTLFFLTFLLNTLAESMRQRFRKRAFEL